MPEPEEWQEFDNVRQAINELVGKRLVEITQFDPDEAAQMSEEAGVPLQGVLLHFDNGKTLTFFVTDALGFGYDGKWESERNGE